MRILTIILFLLLAIFVNSQAQTSFSNGNLLVSSTLTTTPAVALTVSSKKGTSIDVSGVGILNIDYSSGAVTIQNLTGGVHGQTLYLVSIGVVDANFTTLVNTGNIVTNTASDVVIVNKGGGVLLFITDTWYLISAAL